MFKQKFLIGHMILVLYCIAESLSNSIPENEIFEARLSGKEKLTALRNLMKNNNISAYIVPSTDAHMSEYVSKRDKRREYITGFTGSYGTAVITLNKALFWTDGRYFVQAVMQFDPPDAWTLMKYPDDITIGEWLKNNLPMNSSIGIDPHYSDYALTATIERDWNDSGLRMLYLKNNLIDNIWGENQPAYRREKIVPQKFIHSGKIAGDKVKICFDEMEKNQASALLITRLDETAHLLNWRGSDIPYSPVFFSYVILYNKTVHIFVEESKVSKDAENQLKEEMVDFEIHPYDNVEQFLKKLCVQSRDFKKLWLPYETNMNLFKICQSVHLHMNTTPVKIMKYVKTDEEIEGMRQAHIHDAVAIVKYFSWLEDKIINHADEQVTEISGPKQLEKFRMQEENYKGPSFLSLSAAGNHTSMPHYEASPKTNIPITANELYWIDTGSQFPAGTTDVTRTLHFGQPTDYEKKCYTLVFKAQINLAMSTFPVLSNGVYLDSIARKYLSDAGLHYSHGTGHGIGSYLNVHEMPPLLDNKPHYEDTGFLPGMFTSNEPGYYEDGKFGIRLENVELAVKANTNNSKSNDPELLAFETVTLVPYQTKMLNVSMLTDKEIMHLNNYHKKCLDILTPFLQGCKNRQTLSWLKKETQPIQK